MTGSTSIKLSVVIITYNEEKNIERCINSVKSVADDITVIDSLSTDKTVEICNALGATVFDQAFLGHVEQKNFAVSKAKYSHILSLDADEAIDKKLIESIKKAKENWSLDGYTMNRLTNYCGKWIYHCGWYPDPKIRLFNRKKASWGGTNPHDKIIMATGATARHITGDLLHYTFSSVAEHIIQVNKFSEIKAEGLFQGGAKVNPLRMGLEPLLKFFKSYVLKAGFLDGWYGLIICVNSAHATFLRYAKLYDKNRAARNKK